MVLARDREGGLSGAAVLRRLAGAALAGGMLLAAAAPAFAQFGGACNREELASAGEDYVAAQSAGDPTKIHFTLWAVYNQQNEQGTMATGILSTPVKIDFHRTLVDAEGCSAYVEMISTDPANPRVIGAIVTARGGQVNQIDTIYTDKVNGWLFNPANTLKYSSAEKWTEIPPAERDSRATIQAAADAYLDLFNDKKTVVPWGSPCERLEGGMYTGKGGPGVSLPEDSCNVGVPSGQKLVDRHYVIDEALGAVAVMLTFGNNQLPDIHTFRIEHGKIRYVHTITACKTFNCGFKLPDQVKPAAS